MNRPDPFVRAWLDTPAGRRGGARTHIEIAASDMGTRQNPMLSRV
jgi:hypothetical protein